MVKDRRYIAMMTTLLMLAGTASARPVMLEVERGETAFVVDMEAQTAFWVLETCKRPIPIESTKSDVMSSHMVRDIVTLGSRQVELRQQFRFTLATPPSVDVYNSVRGGWSPVPVRVDETCHRTATCRARMELPECPAD